MGTSIKFCLLILF
uniref:BLTX703 n=1 Tax=Nephila pilipes TaxID=299642 RepID=A0A076L0A9_NEPPI|nr:BLTX703 [Nephila pilipes]